jgi:thiol-disulfide isomerase/thioredoxin
MFSGCASVAKRAERPLGVLHRVSFRPIVLKHYGQAVGGCAYPDLKIRSVGGRRWWPSCGFEERIFLQSGNERQKFGEPLSDFSLQSLSGPTVSLSSRLAGKKGAVVVIWSSTCSHCVRYDKYFNGFEERYPDLSLIVVSSRQGETQDSAIKAAAQRRLGFCIVHDPAASVARQWFTQQTPRAFLMDANRALLYRGAIDNYKYSEDPEYIPYLEPAIDQFLNGGAVTRQETASYGCAIQSVYYTLPKAFTKGV